MDEDGADSPSPPPLSVSPSVVAGPSTPVYQMPSARGHSRKRQFDVASLLAPDSGEDTAEEDIDVVSSDQQEQSSPKTLWPNNMFPIVNYYQALLQTRPAAGSAATETVTDNMQTLKK